MRVISETACAMSASRMRLFAAAVFSEATPRLFIAESRRFCSAPIDPREVLTLSMAESRMEIEAFAEVCDPTDSYRFNPQLVPGSEKVWEADSVIISIGQTGELTWVKPEDGLEVTPRGTLSA